ncbi:hypothetical protein EVD20_14870 [Elizabethkingia bruuniana]|nr:hypothetical protein [Elizabethkingia bruuniana]QDZ63614.1 hypothetical protein EVD20_14870 [Elizabethkingia bruuniana]
MIKIISRSSNNARLNIAIMDQYDRVLFINRMELKQNINVFEGVLKGNTMVPGSYKISVAVDNPGVELYDIIKNGLKFEVIDTGNNLSLNGDIDNGIIISPLIWK